MLPMSIGLYNYDGGIFKGSQIETAVIYFQRFTVVLMQVGFAMLVYKKWKERKAS